MFVGLIYIGIGIVIGIYIVSQIKDSIENQNEKLLENIKQFDGERKKKTTNKNKRITRDIKDRKSN